MTASQIEYTDEWYRLRLQTLQAVDDLIRDVIATLETRPDILENTYLFYTTDNGFHMGQHRLPPGKTCAIEEDINIPFIVRGPGVEAGLSVSFPTSHTDIVPTLFELAGIPLHDDFDGTPIPVTTEQRSAATLKPEHVNVEFWKASLGVEGDVFDNISTLKEKLCHKLQRVRLTSQSNRQTNSK
jgi:N-acetylglucosamine-6-sulfatase